jgi:hypothetical protein
MVDGLAPSKANWRCLCVGRGGISRVCVVREGKLVIEELAVIKELARVSGTGVWVSFNDFSLVRRGVRWTGWDFLVILKRDS